MKNDHLPKDKHEQNGIGRQHVSDATVTYMLSTNATPFVKLLVWLLRSFTPTHIFYIRFSSSFYNPWFTLFIAVTKISCQKAP